MSFTETVCEIQLTGAASRRLILLVAYVTHLEESCRLNKFLKPPLSLSFSVPAENP